MCACLMWLSCDLLLVFLTTVARRDRGPMARLCEPASEASIGPLPQKAHPATHRGSRLPPLVVVVEAIENQKEDHDVTNLVAVKLIDMAKNQKEDHKDYSTDLVAVELVGMAKKHMQKHHNPKQQHKKTPKCKLTEEEH